MSKRPGDLGYAPGWCIHYRYNRTPKRPEDDTCEAGIRFDSFTGDARTMARQPCFIQPGQTAADRAPCEKLRPPTPEEIELHEQWANGRMDLMRTVMTGISPWRKSHKGKSAQEIVECPACKGKLHLSISSYNGHVHGKCETADCASWME